VIDVDWNLKTVGATLPDEEYLIQTFAQEVIRRNRATDPNCTATAGKTAGGSAALAASAAWSQFGTTSISITPNGVSSASSCFPQGAAGLTIFEAGKTYTVSAYVRLTVAQTGTLDVNARRISIRANGVIQAVSAAAPNSAAVTRLSVTFTMQPGWTTTAIQVHNGSSVAAQVLWYDGLLVEEGATLNTYYDGSTVDTTSYVYDWTGTVDASASTISFAATSPTSSLIVAADTAPHTKIVRLESNSSRAAFYIPPRDFSILLNPANEWFRNVKSMKPGDSWTYSFDLFASNTVNVYVQARIQRDATKEGPVAFAEIDGQPFRVVPGINGWQTITGTVSLPADEPVGGFLIFGWQVFPGPDVFVDNLVVTAPAETEDRRLVISGRITNVTVQQMTGAGSIELAVTGMGGITDLDNYVIGDEPWGTESYYARVSRIVALIPFSAGASVDYAPLPSPIIAPRDVDAQPILGILSEIAGSFAGVAWPLYDPSVRSHLWIEDPADRNPALIFAADIIEIDACNLDRTQYEVSQSSDQLITLVEMGWMDNDPIEDSYTNRAVQIIDEDAVALYGNRRLSVPSEIASEAGAIEVGEAILDRARLSDWSVTGVSVTNDQLAGAAGQLALMRLLDGRLRPASLVEVANLPEWVPGAVSAGWLEGGSIEYRAGRWHFDLYLTAADTGS